MSKEGCSQIADRRLRIAVQVFQFPTMRHLLDRVWALCKHFGVITLGPDRSRKGTARLLPRTDELDDMSKVVFRSPAKFIPCSFVDVDTINARKHRPSTRKVHLFVARYPSFDNCRRIHTEFLQVFTCQGSRGAHNVAAKPNRANFLESEKMRVDDIRDVRPPIQELID